METTTHAVHEEIRELRIVRPVEGKPSSVRLDVPEDILVPLSSEVHRPEVNVIHHRDVGKRCQLDASFEERAVDISQDGPPHKPKTSVLSDVSQRNAPVYASEQEVLTNEGAAARALTAWVVYCGWVLDRCPRNDMRMCVWHVWWLHLRECQIADLGVFAGAADHKCALRAVSGQDVGAVLTGCWRVRIRPRITTKVFPPAALYCDTYSKSVSLCVLYYRIVW